MPANLPQSGLFRRDLKSPFRWKYCVFRLSKSRYKYYLSIMCGENPHMKYV